MHDNITEAISTSRVVQMSVGKLNKIPEYCINASNIEVDASQKISEQILVVSAILMKYVSE